MSTNNNIYTDSPNPIAINRINYDCKLINDTKELLDKEGIYFGQCSELCGLNHSYMPIVVKAVSKDKYEKWLKEASIEFSSLPKVKNINLAKK